MYIYETQKNGTDDAGGREGQDKLGTQHGHIYTIMSERDSQWEAAEQHRQLSSGLCDGLEEWKAAGRSNREEMYVHTELTHCIGRQTLTQHRTAIILQFEKKKKPCSSLFCSAEGRIFDQHVTIAEITFTFCLYHHRGFSSIIQGCRRSVLPRNCWFCYQTVYSVCFHQTLAFWL